MSDQNIIALLFIISCSLALTVLVLVYRIKAIRSVYYEQRTYHSKFIALYMDAALKNKELNNRISSYKVAIIREIFEPRGMGFDKVMEWYQANNINHKWPDHKDFEDKTVNQLLKLDVEERKKFSARLP